ncbi:MAG: DUF6157 family protein [Firmicutes bacterium]|nr:DUF6157 family protein [Bacillota bacterium]
MRVKTPMGEVVFTTNQTNTFVLVAEDCLATVGKPPPIKSPPTAAQIEYQMIAGNPYQYTSDEVLYKSGGERREISWEEFFSRGQACFRVSALCKRYGFGVHSNAQGKIALYGVESDEYAALVADPTVQKVKAMKSKK